MNKYINNKLKALKICVIGLGYVGLPLAVEFAKVRAVIGFDIDSIRINELQQGFDRTFEVRPIDLKISEKLSFTADVKQIKLANCYIITVPTPIDVVNRPDLRPLYAACEIVSSVLGKDDIVIFESTVFPGATEEELIPLIEKQSKLKFNKDFYCGYSPERINPGDKINTITKIKKVTSGSTNETLEIIDKLYNQIVKAGTHKAESIKIAEAAKVIENIQRDINIALINELSQIFGKMNIDTEAVLNAAASKWNFIPFKPGLVGGHCIGVDPYYLTHKAQAYGHYPEIILAGRRLNDNMSSYVVSQMVKLMVKRQINLSKASILVMGLTFKENCPDFRNTKVIDIINELGDYGCDVDVYDPWVKKDEAIEKLEIEVIEQPSEGNYDGILLAVAHQEFVAMGIDAVRKFGKQNSVVYDLKFLFPSKDTDLRL